MSRRSWSSGQVAAAASPPPACSPPASTCSSSTAATAPTCSPGTPPRCPPPSAPASACSRPTPTRACGPPPPPSPTKVPTSIPTRHPNGPGAAPTLHIIRPRHVILALGGHLPTIPVTGNDIPGVVSARGLRHLLARTGRALAGPVVVIGAGAAARAHADALGAALVGPDEVRRIVGRRRVKAVETATARLPARLVALAPEPAPACELAAQAGAALRWTGSGFAPICDPDGRVQLRAAEHPLADDPPANPPWTLWATGALNQHDAGEAVAAALLRQLARAVPKASHD
ncbi:hypothetical protein [Nannocystis sp.]|uniref:hypothetical protein n=1 Tax=Nannocystis sp. TaxID=1962667 RepID=UPI0025DB6AEC|nr:hypothetical protein [Nannocystis sp.]